MLTIVKLAFTRLLVDFAETFLCEISWKLKEHGEAEAGRLLTEADIKALEASIYLTSTINQLKEER